MFTDLRSATASLETVLDKPGRFVELDGAYEWLLQDAVEVRQNLDACFELSYLVDTVAADVDSVDLEAENLELFIDGLVKSQQVI